MKNYLGYEVDLLSLGATVLAIRVNFLEVIFRAFCLQIVMKKQGNKYGTE
jgi:hypothetical protein